MAYGPTFTISITRRVNLGNYESADIFIMAKDLEPSATEAEIRDMIEEKGELAFNIIMSKINDKVQSLTR